MWSLSTMAKPTRYHGETYSLPWRNLLVTMAKPTRKPRKHLKIQEKRAHEDKKKKIEEGLTPVDNDRTLTSLSDSGE
jgi:hypothetical protein